VGAVAFAVFLHFGDHAAQGLGIDAFFAGDLVLHLAQAIENIRRHRGKYGQVGV
jgi:hypothetical protein